MRENCPEYFTIFSQQIFDFVRSYLNFFGIFNYILDFLVSELCFLSFSLQSNAESSRNFIKKSIFDHLFLQVIHFYPKPFFSLQTVLVDQKTVFFRFLAQICFGTPLKSPQKPSSRSQSCKFPPTCTLP